MADILHFIVFHIIFDSYVLIAFFIGFPIVLLINWIISIINPSLPNEDSDLLTSPIIEEHTENIESNIEQPDQFIDNTIDSIRSQLIDIAHTIWATKKYFLKLITENDLLKKGRQVNSQITRLESVLQSLNIEVEDYTGKKYNESMNITPVDYEVDDVQFPVIKETLEPTILMNNEICKKAKVIVAVPSAHKGGE